VTSRGRRLLLWLILALLGGIGVFVAVVRVDRVVVGRGKLVPVDERTDVRLSTAGVVVEVYAGEGEQVSAGQLLLRLEDATERGRLERLRKDLDRAQRQLATLDKTIAIVEATLRTGETEPVADPAAAETIEAWRIARDAHAEETRRRHTVLPARRQVAQARLDASKAELAAARAAFGRAEKAAARAEAMLKEKLLDRESHEIAVGERDVKRGLVEAAEAGLSEARQSLAMITVEADEKLAAASSRLKLAEAALRDEAARLRASHATTQVERETFEVEIESIERVLGLLAISAPVNGLVSYAAPIVPSDRVEANQHVFSISTSSLVSAVASFANRDAGSLRPGAPCKLKLDAFPFERFGVLRGRLESVALEPVVDSASGTSVFRARLAVQRVGARAGTDVMTLRPGLTLAAEIVTGRPRIISLLFEPVRRLLGVGATAPVTADPSPVAPPRSGGGPAIEPRTPFAAERAFGHLKALARLGPRHLGTDALESARAYVRTHLESAGLLVEVEEFRVKTPGGERSLRNLLARFPGPDEESYVLLATHLDTKRLEGVTGFAGANEGASGAAVLLECARVVAALEPRPAVRFVFFDGKEALGRSGPRHGLYGSRAFVGRIVARGGAAAIRAVIVCDMVGDRDLVFTDDLRSTSSVARALLAAGKRLGHGDRFELAGEEAIPVAVRNDHVPFLRAGIPAGILCDYDFGGADAVRRMGRNRYRHTVEDRLERVSRNSLQIAGDVLVQTSLDFERHDAK
jgi:HlyD family type I secretion membrane fusion protein